MKNLNPLREKLRAARDSKEDFYLQGSRLQYHVSERVIPPDPELETKLRSLSEDKNPNTMEYLSALLGAFDMTILTSEDMDFKITNEIKVLLDRLHASNNGMISLGELLFSRKERTKTPLDLKVSAPGKSLLHEMFVTFFVTNRLRRIIPNFQLCFAGLKAHTPPPSVVYLESHACPVDTSEKVDYLLLEHLDGVSMEQALKTCKLEEFLAWFCQILFTLEMGVVHCGFTHNNLTPANVQIVPVVVPVDEAFSVNLSQILAQKKIVKNVSTLKIRYFHHNETWLLDTNSIAVIKNFELAHVKHKYDLAVEKTEGSVQEIMVVNRSEHFGPVGLEEFGIFYNETRPFFDIYKFLMSSIRIAQLHNRPLYADLKVLAGFFGHTTLNSLEKVLQEEEHLGYLYNVEISTLERSRSLRELLAFTIASFPKELSGILAKQSSFSEAVILSCPRYCLLDGYEVVTFSGNGKGEEFILENWTLREVLERLEGLQKRSQELKRISNMVCRSNFGDEQGPLCQPLSEEALEAKNQYREFLALVKAHATQLRDRQVAEMVRLRDILNEKIRLVNIDGDSYRIFKSSTGKTAGTANLEHMRLTICREREAIKGKIVNLVSQLSYLNLFREQFPAVGEAPPLSLAEMNSFD